MHHRSEASLTLNYRGATLGKTSPASRTSGPTAKAAASTLPPEEVLFRRLAACARLVCFDDLERVSPAEAASSAAAAADAKLDWEPVSTFEAAAPPPPDAAQPGEGRDRRGVAERSRAA